MKAPPRRARWLIVLAAVFALFSATGFWIAPPILKTQLEQRLALELGRRVSVERVKVNPYTLAVTLEHFAIQERDAAQAFIRCNRLHVNFDALASLGGEWVFGAIALDGFDARVDLRADHSLNFSDLLTKFAPAAATNNRPRDPPSASRPVRIERLEVAHAQVAFSDATRAEAFATTLGPVTFSLTEFRTAGQRDAPYRFEAISEAGEKLTWTGTLQTVPLRSVGELKLEKIVLAKYAPYYGDRFGAEIAAGTLSLEGGYELDLSSAERALRLKGGALHVRDLKLVERATNELALEVENFAVTHIDADALALKAAIRSVSADGGRVRLRRDPNGTLNLLSLLRPVSGGPLPKVVAPAVHPPGSPSTAPQRPEVTVADVAVKNVRVEAIDLATPRPAEFALNNVQLSLKNVTLADGARMPLQLAFGWAPQGIVHVGGVVGLAPLAADVEVDVANFELRPLSPYLEQFVNARLTDGTVAATLETRTTLEAGAPLATTITGDVQIDRLKFVDGTHLQDLAGIRAASVRGLRASTVPELSLALDELQLAAPFAHLIVHRDRTLNLASALGSESAARPPALTAPPTGSAPASVEIARASPPPAAARALDPRIEIAKVTIADGEFRFTDRSVQPNVAAIVDQFGGSIAGLSSTNRAQSQVNVKGRVNATGSFAITGKLDALGPKPAADLAIAFTDVDLAPLSPYAGKFAGYEIAAGTLLLDAKLLVDGNQVDATNVLTLDQFTFGKAVPSPEATRLPVRLGVALLKDANGKIVIDLPVQGNLADPNLRVDRVALRGITNLLTKAATSPFALLGAAIGGGGGEELAFQEFAPGSAELRAAQAKKLQTLVQALAQRPSLSVSLQGSYDPTADAPALQRAKLAEQVRRAAWQRKHPQNVNTRPPADFIVTAAEHAATIQRLFVERFPGALAAAAPPPAPPPPPSISTASPRSAIVAAATRTAKTAAAKSAKYLQSLFRVVTLQSDREERRILEEIARPSGARERAAITESLAPASLEEMTSRLADTIAIDDTDLRTLADIRARRVRDYLTNTGKISPERIQLASETSDGTAASTPTGSRVTLSLQ